MCVIRSRRRGRRHGRGGPAWRLAPATASQPTTSHVPTAARHGTARHGGLVSPFRGGISGWCVRISLPVSPQYVGTSCLGFPFGWVGECWRHRPIVRARRVLQSEGCRWGALVAGVGGCGDGEDDRKRPAGARASSLLARRRSLVSPSCSTRGRGGEKERLARHVNVVPVRRLCPFLLWTSLFLLRGHRMSGLWTRDGIELSCDVRPLPLYFCKTALQNVHAASATRRPLGPQLSPFFPFAERPKVVSKLDAKTNPTRTAPSFFCLCLSGAILLKHGNSTKHRLGSHRCKRRRSRSTPTANPEKLAPSRAQR